MQEGEYECVIIDAGIDENKDGKAYAWLSIQPEGHGAQELKLWLHTDECRGISEANLRSLGWAGAWVDGWENEIINQKAAFRYGRDKTGQYMNWSFPFRSKKNSSVLDRLSVTQPARPKTAGKASQGRPATAAALTPPPQVKDDDVPF
jgi:hypothetical protein